MTSTVRIVSDGITQHTSVTVDGTPLPNVTAVTWSARASDDLARCTVEFAPVEVDVVGEIPEPNETDAA